MTLPRTGEPPEYYPDIPEPVFDHFEDVPVQWNGKTVLVDYSVGPIDDVNVGYVQTPDGVQIRTDNSREDDQSIHEAVIQQYGHDCRYDPSFYEVD